MVSAEQMCDGWRQAFGVGENEGWQLLIVAPFHLAALCATLQNAYYTEFVSSRSTVCGGNGQLNC